MAWAGLDDFVTRCRTAARACQPAEAIEAVMAEAVADPAAVLVDMPAFPGDDHVVVSDEEIAVYLVRQRPLVAGPPHDHRMSAVVGMLKGIEIHRHYERVGTGLRPAGETRLGPAEVIRLGPEDVHAIVNPEAGESLGLHVYLGDLDGGARTLWDPETGEAQPFTAAGYARLERRYA